MALRFYQEVAERNVNPTMYDLWQKIKGQRHFQSDEIQVPDTNEEWKRDQMLGSPRSAYISFKNAWHIIFDSKGAEII